MSEGIKGIAVNKKAFFNYFVEDKVECGIVLEGSEVKSLREGSFSFTDSFAQIVNNEVFLYNFNIRKYSHSAAFIPDSGRAKKLLLKKDEIKRLVRKTAVKGYTLIPTEFYFKNGKVKVKIALCKGKKLYDKRESIKERDVARLIEREFKERNR